MLGTHAQHGSRLGLADACGVAGQVLAGVLCASSLYNGWEGSGKCVTQRLFGGWRRWPVSCLGAWTH